MADRIPFSQFFRNTLASAIPLRPGGLQFSVIDERDWSIPSWLNASEIRKGFERQAREGVFHGGIESYHHMVCLISFRATTSRVTNRAIDSVDGIAAYSLCILRYNNLLTTGGSNHQ